MRHCCCRLWMLLVSAALGASIGRAHAETAVIYSAGKAWPLIRSPDELLVHFEAQASPSQAAAALSAQAARPLAELAELPGRGRVQLVAVARADQAAVHALRRLRGVRQVTFVYRLRPGGQPLLLTDQVLVRFPESITDQQLAEFCARHGAELVGPLGRLSRAYILRLAEPDGARAIEAAARMYHDPITRFCHPDLIMPKCPAAINDPLYPDQWHLNNTGQGGSSPDADIDAPEAWNLTEGAGAVVAIYDDAIDIGHPDLADTVVWSWDYGGADADPSPSAAGENHGTAVAGVAVARANAIGVRGSAPAAGLIAIRWGSLLSDDVNSLYDSDAHGASVHSNSWSYSTPIVPEAMRQAIQDLYSNGRGGLGLLVLFAAGNDGGTIAENNPVAGLPETLAVGASTNLDTHPSYSNTGPELDLVAPSNGGSLAITTTDVRDGIFPTDGYSVGDYTDGFGGTSSATPLVAGTAALCLAVNPNLTAVQLRAILEHTADPIGSGYDATTSHSDSLGYGRLNAEAAVQAASESLTNGGYTWPDHVGDAAVTDASPPLLSWVNPPDEAATVMIVRAQQSFDFKPTDGTNYSVGQTVAGLAEVVYNQAGSSFEDTTAPAGTVYYAIFVRNAIDRWSWGTKLQASVPGPPSLTALELTGPIDVNEGAAVQYHATAHFSDDSSLDVTDQADWTAGPADVLTVSQPGVILVGQVDADCHGQVSASYSDSQSGSAEGSLDVAVRDVLSGSQDQQSGTEPDPEPPAPAGCCGAASPVTPLALTIGWFVLCTFLRRRYR